MKNKNKMWKSWVFRFPPICCFLLVAIGLTNFIADPLWTFGNNGWWNKYRAGFDERQQKTNYLPHIIDEIDGIVIGSSMSRLLGTQDFHGLKIYNYACSSLWPDDAAEFIRHAVREKGDVLTAFIGLDFWNTNPSIAKATNKSPLFYIQNVTANQALKNIISIDPLWWSLKTIIWNFSTTGKIDFHPSLYVFIDRFPMLVISEDISGKSMKEEAKKIAHLDGYKNYTTIPFKKLKKTLAELDVTPTFFITPVTPPYLKKIIEVGAYPTYEKFIRDTVHLFGSVWNFMYLNSVTVSDQYFYDVNHTNNKGGRAIAQRISGGSDYPADFGILVTEENLEEHIRFLRHNIFDTLSADIEPVPEAAE